VRPWIVTPLVVVKLRSPIGRARVPILPPRVIAPAPVVIVTFWLLATVPVIVPLIVIAPLLALVSMVELPVKCVGVVALASFSDAAVMLFATLNCDAFVTVIALSAVLLPTAPENVTLPVDCALSVKLRAPSIVLLKEMLLPAPADVEVMVLLLVKTTGPVNVMTAFVAALVVMLPLMEMSPPVAAKAVSAVLLPTLLDSVTMPPELPALSVKLWAPLIVFEKVILPGKFEVLTVTSPPRVVIGVTATLFAVTLALKATEAALEMRKLSSALVPPITPVNVTTPPVPALKVRSCAVEVALLVVPVTVMFAPAAEAEVVSRMLASPIEREPVSAIAAP